MNKIIAFISSIGIDLRDEEDTLLQKRFLVYQAVLMSIGGIVWGILAYLFNRKWQSIVPFGYTVLAMINLYYFHSSKNFKVTKYIQTAISLLLPFIFQWCLGGFIPSGAVMLWSLLSLIILVIYQNDRMIAIWFGLFILLALFSTVFDSRFGHWANQSDVKYFSIIFLVLNIVTITTIVLWLFNFMVSGKNELFQKLKEAQKVLIQSEKMASLGELTAGIAHEIQNPLNFVNNFSEINSELIAEIIEDRSKKLEERSDKLQDELIGNIKANLEKINHHGKRAENIVRGMLEHSRKSTGVKELTDINALADEYLRLSYHSYLFGRQAFKSNDNGFSEIKLNTSFDPNLPLCNVVPQDIGRVLLNLYNNAFYACAERGRKEIEVQHSHLLSSISYLPIVSVNTKMVGDKIFISVNDNGNGIPQKIIDKIFQPFFTTKPTGHGTGLGLSLAYDIIKAHGGELKVESQEAHPLTGHAEGSQFIIILYNNLK